MMIPQIPLSTSRFTRPDCDIKGVSPWIGAKKSLRKDNKVCTLLRRRFGESLELLDRRKQIK